MKRIMLAIMLISILTALCSCSQEEPKITANSNVITENVISENVISEDIIQEITIQEIKLNEIVIR